MYDRPLSVYCAQLNHDELSEMTNQNRKSNNLMNCKKMLDSIIRFDIRGNVEWQNNYQM